MKIRTERSFSFPLSTKFLSIIVWSLPFNNKHLEKTIIVTANGVSRIEE